MLHSFPPPLFQLFFFKSAARGPGRGCRVPLSLPGDCYLSFLPVQRKPVDCRWTFSLVPIKGFSSAWKFWARVFRLAVQGLLLLFRDTSLLPPARDFHSPGSPREVRCFPSERSDPGGALLVSFLLAFPRGKTEGMIIVFFPFSLLGMAALISLPLFQRSALLMLPFITFQHPPP